MSLNQYAPPGKVYDVNPRYSLNISNYSNLGYEIRINDFYGTYHKSDGINPMSISLPINDLLLDNGEQEIHIIILPEAGEDHLEDVSDEDMTISIVRDEEHKTVEDQIIYEFQVKLYEISEDNTERIEVKDLFNVSDLPYKLEGWKNGQDLHSIPNIESKVINAYEKYLNVVSNSDVTTFMNSSKFRTTELHKAFYIDSLAAQSFSNDLVEMIADTSKKMLPLENYNFVFLGNGKMVLLEKRDEMGFYIPAIQATAIDQENDEVEYYYDLVFYMPNGSDSLQIIR